MNLTYKHEKPLFIIAMIIATVFWVVLIGVTLGLALIYVLLGFVAYLFAQSGFISYIKGNGVRISERQYPALYKSLTVSCQKLNIDVVPDMYLLRTDFFNALATKFLGRNFIVLFTDVVDALADEPGAIDFYIGHELGHIDKHHLRWQGFMFPAMLLPVLGTALRRAQEYTCDRYGAYCCGSASDVQHAIAAISAGDTSWRSVNVDAYLEQIQDTPGFWMSFHELTGDYPWLTKRMASALAFRRNEDIKHPRRHWFAGLLSIFVPRFGSGGGFSLIIAVAVVGVLAAIAIPAYQDYTIRAQVAEGLQVGSPVKGLVVVYARDYNKWPVNGEVLGIADDASLSGKYVSGVDVDEGIVVITYGNKANVVLSGKSLLLVPDPENFPEVSWACFSEEIDSRYLPSSCRR